MCFFFWFFSGYSVSYSYILSPLYPFEITMSEQSAFLSNTSIIHSYPFINDGPKLQEPLTEHNCYTRHVPPGVLHIKPSWKPVKLDEKPPFSYATMIAHAILSSEHRRLTLSEIYQWISEQYPCYHITDHRWQVRL
jgi:hypothetical protein